MPESVRVHSPVDITAARLTAEAFAPFGDVIANPRPDVQPSPAAFALLARTGTDAVPANQGSAIKYQRVSGLADHYASGQAPSGQPSAPLASMFVCAARTLLPDPSSGGASAGLFPVTILERHPYTTQTFVPLCPDSHRARYLVIVAPTLADGSSRPPDVRGLRAFVARGDQAVTYGAATWHAPMAALGAAGTALPFFVFQFANGVGPEDCQEVVLDGESSAEGTSAVVVRVPPAAEVPGLAAKL